MSSIGRRYRRQDEVGITAPCVPKGAGQAPYCVTVDFESLEYKKVTVRDRDSMKQERIAIQELLPYLEDNLG